MGNWKFSENGGELENEKNGGKSNILKILWTHTPCQCVRQTYVIL